MNKEESSQSNEVDAGEKKEVALPDSEEDEEAYNEYDVGGDGGMVGVANDIDEDVDISVPPSERNGVEIPADKYHGSRYIKFPQKHILKKYYSIQAAPENATWQAFAAHYDKEIKNRIMQWQQQEPRGKIVIPNFADRTKVIIDKVIKRCMDTSKNTNKKPHMASLINRVREKGNIEKIWDELCFTDHSFESSKKHFPPIMARFIEMKYVTFKQAFDAAVENLSLEDIEFLHTFADMVSYAKSGSVKLDRKIQRVRHERRVAEKRRRNHLDTAKTRPQSLARNRSQKQRNRSKPPPSARIVEAAHVAALPATLKPAPPQAEQPPSDCSVASVETQRMSNVSAQAQAAAMMAINQPANREMALLRRDISNLQTEIESLKTFMSECIRSISEYVSKCVSKCASECVSKISEILKTKCMDHLGTALDAAHARNQVPNGPLEVVLDRAFHRNYNAFFGSLSSLPPGDSAPPTGIAIQQHIGAKGTKEARLNEHDQEWSNRDTDGMSDIQKLPADNSLATTVSMNAKRKSRSQEVDGFRPAKTNKKQGSSASTSKKDEKPAASKKRAASTKHEMKQQLGSKRVKKTP